MESQEVAGNLLTAGDVAERMHVSKATVWRWVNAEVLKPIKINGVTRFHPDDVQVLIEKGRA